MSGFGKARNPRYAMSDIVQVKRDIKLLYSLGRVNASPSQTVIPFVTGVHSASAPAGYQGLNVSGGSMIGPIAYSPIVKNLTYSGGIGHLDISNSTGAFTSCIFLGAVGTLQLYWIDGDAFDGQVLKILIPIGSVLHVNTTGNIFTTSGGTVDVSGIGFANFVFSSTENGWILDTSSSGTGANTSLSNLTNPTAINQNLIFGDGTAAQSKSISNVNILGFKSAVGGPGTGNPENLSVSGDGTVLNVNLNGQSGSMKFSTIPASGGQDVFEVFNGGQVKSVNLAVPSAGRTIGTWNFDAYLGDGVTRQSYCELLGSTQIVTSGNESGQLDTYVYSLGSLVKMQSFSGKDQQIQQLYPIKIDQGGGNPPLIIDTLATHANYASNGGHLFENQAKSTFYFGAFKPNVFYQGISCVVNARSNASYTVDSTNGSGSDLIITMTDNTFTRNCQLPDANTFSGRFLIVKNLGTKSVSFTTVGGQTVDGVASGGYTILQYNSAILFSSGGQWFVAAKV